MRSLRVVFARIGSTLVVVFGLTGCLRDDRMIVDVPFVARWQGASVRCVDAPGSGLSLRDLRMFVHDVRLVTDDGRSVRAELVRDGVFQTERVALLDFENGRGSCTGGTSGTHTHLRVRAPRGRYAGIRFRVGVPFRENHADAALADPPLTAGTLHWGWRGGYKFLRFEAFRGETRYRVHLGSTGCEGAIARITRCARANRPRVALAGMRPGRPVSLDLDQLVDPGGTDCMGTTDTECVPPFASLGLGLVSGASARDARLFGWGAP